MAASLADYRTLGRSGLRVSPLCLGTMTFGQDWGWGADEAESVRMLDRYAELGGNFLDTANIYTKGHSEVILGDYLKARGGRDRWVIATKFCGNLHSGDPNAGGASRKSILQNLDESLRRLRTDFVDLYWMHFNDPHTPMDETLRALDDAVRAGKVRYLGFSDTPAWRVVEAQMLARLKDWTPLIALQIEYSLIERTVEHDLLPMAKAFGLGVTPWSPLKGGLLSGKYGRNRHPEGEGRHKPDSRYLTEATYRVLDALEAVAAEQGAGMAETALAWVMAKPGVASPILGARTLAQLDGNLKALALTLTPAQLARVDEASAPAPIFPHGFLVNTKNVMQGGTVVNGLASELWPLAPKTDAERW
ncbi:MAG TPA: aldo/keto reductase [Holophagaceae bacterium]|nr:aldo/keto reductase [Holophagaceae bacterium]